MAIAPEELADTPVNTEYGTITVARALLALWNRYGWPSDDTLQTIAEEQGVYPPPRTRSPGRKTLDQMNSDDLDELHARLARAEAVLARIRVYLNSPDRPCCEQVQRTLRGIIDRPAEQPRTTVDNPTTSTEPS
jgi:hypothetical protein